MKNNHNSITLPVLCILFLALFSSQLFARNSFLVAPGRVDFDLARPVTQSFIITNNGDNKIRLSIEPVYFAIDSKSLAAGEPLDKAHADKDDLRQYIRVSPRTLSLRPGQRRDIRISVRTPADLAEGDYRAHLLVRMLETAITQTLANESDNGIGMKINIKMETAVAIYGHKGQRDPQLNVQCTRDESGHMALTITNPGIWRFEGWFDIFAAENADTGLPLTRKHVNSLRESRRTFPTDWLPDHSGPFVVRWSDRADLIQGQINCTLSD